MTVLLDSSGFNMVYRRSFLLSQTMLLRLTSNLNKADISPKSIRCDTELSSASGESLSATVSNTVGLRSATVGQTVAALPSSDAGSIPDLCLIKVASLGFINRAFGC